MEGNPHCISRAEEGLFAGDGFCSHEAQHSPEGLVFDNIIENPLHQERFDVVTGKAPNAPVCEELKTYPFKLHSEGVYVSICK